jgi:hypothetical protein
MYTSWERGDVLPTDWQDELCEVLELPPAALGFVPTSQPSTPPALELPSLLNVVRLDPAVIQLLEQQTDMYRMQDRVLGAAIIPQTQAHVRNLENMLCTALPGKHLPDAAVALAEAAALAGWQALDAGDPRKAWDLHDIAKSAARQAENPASLAHVTLNRHTPCSTPGNRRTLLSCSTTPTRARTPARSRPDCGHGSPPRTPSSWGRRDAIRSDAPAGVPRLNFVR